jgi:hypothetical protein
MDAGGMTIGSSSVVLINQKTTIDSLSFQSNDGNVAGMNVEAGIDLATGKLSQNHALLVDTGKLTINGANTLGDVSLWNAGEVDTAQPLDNVSYLWNCALLRCRTWGRLLLLGST